MTPLYTETVLATGIEPDGTSEIVEPVGSILVELPALVAGAAILQAFVAPSIDDQIKGSLVVERVSRRRRRK